MEKLSSKESVECAKTVLRGSVRAPEGFSEGTLKNLFRGQLFHSAPRIFNSCSEYQFCEAYRQMKLVFTLYYSTV